MILVWILGAVLWGLFFYLAWWMHRRAGQDGARAAEGILEFHRQREVGVPELRRQLGKETGFDAWISSVRKRRRLIFEGAPGSPVLFNGKVIGWLPKTKGAPQCGASLK